MIEVFKKFKILIIIVVVIVVGFIGYTIFTSPADESSAALTKTTTENTNVNETSSQANDLAKSFVDQLLAIQSINLRVEFVKDPVFVALIDNHVDIERQEIGRPNPFAPIGKDVGKSSGLFQDINGGVVTSEGGDASRVPSSVFGSSDDTPEVRRSTSTATSTATTTIRNRTNRTQ